MKLHRSITPLLIAMVAFCANGRAADASLFERIGGEAVMSRAVDEMVATIARDPTVNESLQGINLAKFSHKLYVHMCATTGGPCVYTGDDMKTTHQGMNLTRQQLDKSAAALRAALAANGVGQREIDELMRIREPMKEEILAP